MTNGAYQLNLRAVRAIVLAVLSLLCIGAAVLTTPIRVVGTVFSIVAPLLALAGVIVGGLEISQRKRAGQSRDAAVAGVIISAICFFPALATTFTCGVCNALWSTSPELKNVDWIPKQLPPGTVHFDDGGLPALPPPPFPSTVPAPPDAGAKSSPGLRAPAGQDVKPSSPPSLPAPPLPAGPRR